MRVTLLVIGKTRDVSLEKLIETYAQRLKKYISFDIVATNDVREVADVEIRKDREGTAALRLLNTNDYVVLLDEKGIQMNSRHFADWINKHMCHSNFKRIVFFVGGPYGFSEKVRQRADMLLSLSDMTFPHDLVRLLFIEQLYRCFTILNGQNYHHD